MREDFLEPDRGGGLIGWAVKQLALWSMGGLAVYWLASAYGLMRPSSPDAGPRAAVPAASSADAPQQARPALGRPSQLVVNSLALKARPDGYVYVKASVNGAPLTMAFDTGAAVVSLTQADAARAGVAGALDYSLSFATANGRGLGAPVRLREIRIGQLVVEDVEAVVMQNMSVSLLGQTFLKRLDSYQMRDGVLTLTWQ